MQKSRFALVIEKDENGRVSVAAANRNMPMDTVLMQLRVFFLDQDDRYFANAIKNISFSDDSNQ